MFIYRPPSPSQNKNFASLGAPPNVAKFQFCDIAPLSVVGWVGARSDRPLVRVGTSRKRATPRPPARAGGGAVAGQLDSWPAGLAATTRPPHLLGQEFNHFTDVGKMVAPRTCLDRRVAAQAPHALQLRHAAGHDKAGQ